LDPAVLHADAGRDVQEPTTDASVLDASAVSDDASPVAAQDAAFDHAVLLGVGGSSSCVTTSSGGMKCWGWNWAGQIGDGTTTDRSVPTQVVSMTDGGVVGLVAHNDRDVCAIMTSGRAKCWGQNIAGELGDGTRTTRLTPVDVVGLSGIVSIAMGDEHACALISTGDVKCWGDNGSGQLGDGSNTASLSPVLVQGLGGIPTAIASGWKTTCALLATGAVKCWGDNAFAGEIGDGTNSNRSSPTQVVGLGSGVTAIAMSVAHACALTSAGGVKCWGQGAYNALGNGSTVDSWTPVDVVGLPSGAVGIRAGDLSACTIMHNRDLACWGLWSMPLPSWTPKGYGNTPITIQGLHDVVDWGGNAFFNCALLASGGVRCWGGDSNGQLGDGHMNHGGADPVAVVGFP
jgi:alpha-tubulin suppressor-like RCC1 family protein